MANSYILTSVFLSNVDEREKKCEKCGLLRVLYTLLDFACPDCGHIQQSTVSVNSICKQCAHLSLYPPIPYALYSPLATRLLV